MADFKVGDLMQDPTFWGLVGGMGAALSPDKTWSRDLGTLTANIGGNMAHRKAMLEATGQESGNLSSLLDYGLISPEMQNKVFEKTPTGMTQAKDLATAATKAAGVEERATLQWKEDLRNKNLLALAKYEIPENIKKLVPTGMKNLSELINAGYDPEKLIETNERIEQIKMAGKDSKEAKQYGVLTEVIKSRGALQEKLAEVALFNPKITDDPEIKAAIEGLTRIQNKLSSELQLPTLDTTNVGGPKRVTQAELEKQAGAAPTTTAPYIAPTSTFGVYNYWNKVAGGMIPSKPLVGDIPQNELDRMINY